MFKEESRTTAITGTAESGDYKYKVNYNLSGNSILSIHCDVYKKVSEEVTTSTGTETSTKEDYTGDMSQESGNKQYCFPQETSDIATHVEVFETILSEIKSLEVKE